MLFALDTDVLTLILLGDATINQRFSAHDAGEFAVPAIVVEELLRGRLSVIREAESGRAKVAIERAYDLFIETIEVLQSFTILRYTAEAEAIFNEWKSQKQRGSTHDLRIAASCVAAGVTLVSRNRRDFGRMPGLTVEFW